MLFEIGGRRRQLCQSLGKGKEEEGANLATSGEKGNAYGRKTERKRTGNLKIKKLPLHPSTIQLGISAFLSRLFDCHVVQQVGGNAIAP